MFEIPLVGKLLSTSGYTYLNDIIDRLHWNITVSVLILCALFVGTKQQFGQPIQCMLPTHLDRNSWSSYGQYYCFVKNTYRLTFNKALPNANSRAELRSNSDVNYYQWVPLFLTMQALCFYIPGWLWTTLQGQRALDMEAVVREAVSLKATFKFEDRVKKLTNLVNYIASGLKLKVNVSKTKWYKFPIDKISGLSVAIYLLSKFLNVVNNAVQLYIIGQFIGSSSLSWSLTKMPFISSYFPLITFCDMEQQTLGKVEMNTLQCVLMLNFINEKIFFMLWYWISLESELNDECCFLLQDKRRLHIYATEFLGLDGALLLRFINNHAGIITARDITVGLWHYFCDFYQDSNCYISREAVANIKKS
ncbi:unnamed protein product [Acanthocheilonema viteae]|uniref:Innexin n=1 Tax=Acanthocheilonema viteae TaxID=6277 RepID=A0A498SPN9_ACAVI|nr:unnamed protein product [Acanthocheilonema viteae]